MLKRPKRATAGCYTNYTITITPHHVALQDQDGNRYSLVGAISFGATVNANTGGFRATSTDKFQIVSQGRGHSGHRQWRGAHQPKRHRLLQLRDLRVRQVPGALVGLGTSRGWGIGCLDTAIEGGRDG